MPWRRRSPPVSSPSRCRRTSPWTVRRSREHGDYATPVAMKLAKTAGRPPREIAGDQRPARRTPGIAERRGRRPRLSEHPHRDRRRGRAGRPDRRGRSQAYGTATTMAPARRVNLEFVSANPTGPMHIGGARWAAVGDALGRILSTQGAQGRPGVLLQRRRRADRPVRPLPARGRARTARPGRRLRRRLHRRHRGPDHRRLIPAPPDLAGRAGARAPTAAQGVELMFDEIKADPARVPHRLRRLLPRELAARDRARSRRRSRGSKHSGHLYAKTAPGGCGPPSYGDDKDRVVIKSDGEPAYIAGDLAYFLDKRARGFDLCIYMLGADHHGYIVTAQGGRDRVRRRPGRGRGAHRADGEPGRATASRCG